MRISDWSSDVCSSDLLCFGRLDSLSGETSYIGRIGLLDADNDYEPVLLDWRAPASRPFYVATAANPENMRRRRPFHTRSEERRVGNEGGSTFRSRWWPYTSKNKRY